MKLKLIATNGTPFFVIKYEDGEWDMLRKKYEDLGLEVAKTEHGCGLDYTYTYFRDPKNTFSNSVARNLNVRNDINSSFYDRGMFNIAMLRIVPATRTSEVKIPLLSYPSIQEIRNITTSLGQVLKMTLETICSMEVTLVLKKAEDTPTPTPANS